MNEISSLINTTQVAKLLSEITGDRWDRKKVHLYWKYRDKLPQPDEYIGNIPCWYRETIEKYAKGVQ